jgi:hypothetical protein
LEGIPQPEYWNIAGSAWRDRRYRQNMARSKRLSAGLTALAVVLATSALAGSAYAKASTTSGTGKARTRARTLLHSHELWATIDVCNPSDQPNTIGIRGSMPGDGHAHDKMFMSFRLQYMNASKQWVNLASGASSGFVAVGSGTSARQGGTSFELKPVTGTPAVTLRGVVDFQWRHGKTVEVSGAEPTAAGHKSLAGADPANFSAATCVIG